MLGDVASLDERAPALRVETECCDSQLKVAPTGVVVLHQGLRTTRLSQEGRACEI